jgi:thiosulfate dehydrogenase (quinone) large subunit
MTNVHVESQRAEFRTNWLEQDISLAYALLRVNLGINVAIHGVSRIWSGVGVFASTLANQFQSTPLPGTAVSAFAYALPWVEAIIGVLILFGLFTREALAAASVLMAILMFGATLRQDWNAAGFQVAYALAYFILLSLCRYNRFALDDLRRPRAQS